MMCLVVIGLPMACALNSQGTEYAGWAVGAPASADGPATILKSIDSGLSWTQQGNAQMAGVTMLGVHAVDANTAWVAGTGGAIYHTTDGGLIWNQMVSATQVSTAGLQKVTTFGDSSVWAVGSGVILHSGDSGATWTNQLPADYAGVSFQGISTPDGVNVWATGSSATDGHATILKSSDGGLHWTRQSDVKGLDQILDVSSVNATTAWVIGSNGAPLAWTILATTDGGDTWTEKSHSTGDGNGVCAVDASTVWAVTDNNTQWSTDGGATWSDTKTQAYTMGICAIDAQTAWAVSAAGSGAIQWTTDGGQTWGTQTLLDGGEPIPALFTVSFVAVPEPSSAALLALLASALALARSRRAHQAGTDNG